MNFSEDKDSLTFQNRVDYKFDPKMCGGSGFNDTSDRITVPNLVMMTGMPNSETQELPVYLKKSIAWSIISENAGYNTSFISLPVQIAVTDRKRHERTHSVEKPCNC